MVDCTIIDKLNYILETKDLIKTALETQDVEVLESDTFRKYSEYVTEIRKVASVNGETGDIILKTINGQNLVGEGNIIIQGGEGGTAGVNKIILGEEDYGWNAYQGDVKLTNTWMDLDDDGVSETYDVRIGDGNGSSLWFGFNSTDNSIKIEDNGSRLSFTVNPDILGGNVDLSDYYTKEETYSKDEVNDLLENSGGGVVTETDPIFTSWKNDDSIVAGNNAVNGYTNFGILMERNNVVVIGNNAKVQVDGGVAIGSNATVVNGTVAGVAIGSNATANGSFSTNINDVIKGDTSKNAYIKDSTGTYTKILDLINNAGGNVDLSDYYTKGEVYNKNEVNELIDEVNAGDVDLTNYYTKQEVDDKIPSLDGYATEQWVEDKKYLTEHQSLEDYAKKTDIPDVSEFIKEIPSEYITEEELNGKGYLTSIPDTYVTDEELSTAVSDKVSQNTLNEAIQDVDDKIPTEYVKRLGIKDNNLVYKDENDTVTGFATLATVDGKSILGSSNISVGVTSINETEGDVTLKTINGESILGEGNITIEGGGTTGVEAINIGRDIQDWTQKNGVVSFYSDWYDGSYDVAIGGTSFFGIKPIDNSIILEHAGGTVNGNSRCGIKINTDNFKTINGESIIGEGNITIEGGSGTINIIELTQAEYDALTEYADNTFYVITDANKQYTTLEEVEQQGYLKAIPDTYVTDGELSTAISDKVSQNALNEAIEGLASEQWVEDKKYLTEHQQLKTINGESIVGEGNITIEGGITEETDPVFTEWKDKTIQVIIGSGATGSDNTQFDNISIGRGARGGTRTVAIGGYSYIDSKYSTSLGTNTKSSADAIYSVIIGYSASGNSENSVAIGSKAKVESGVTNGCAIGANTESNATFNTNINNVLKGDTSNYAYILDADGNYVKIIDTYYTKTEIDNLIGGVSDKISDINSMI